MKIGLVPTDLLYNVRQERARRASDYELISKENKSEIESKLSDFLKLGGRTHLLWTLVQQLSLGTDVSTSTESVTSQDSDVNK